MFWRLNTFLLLGAALAATGNPVLAEPANLGNAKQAITAYVDSGAYAGEIAKVAQEATTWLEERATSRKLHEAVVFDLDETLLSNLPLMRSLDFGYVPKMWDDWTSRGEAPALAPVVAVYQAAKRLGFEVIVITGRRERDRSGTERNLRAIGCGAWAVSVFKPDESRQSTGEFKRAARRKLQAQGWVLVANIGDQDSDFLGGLAEKNFKLPDPFYLTK